MFPFRFRRLHGAALLAALLTFCSFSSAQDGGATGLDDIIELPEFVVQADEGTGYLKTNTISATRLNANVKDLPMPVEVITSDFIKDTGARSVQDAVQFSAGLETNTTLEQPGDNTTDNTAFRLRGFVQEAALRNGFRKIGNADSFNITQVDVVRGPNALLYGVNNFGGVINYITRRPSSEPRYGMSFSVDDDNGYRVSANATGPITENLRYSLAALYEENRSWYDPFEIEKVGIAPVVEWQPFKGTTILFDLEFLESEGTTSNNDPFRFTADLLQDNTTLPGAPEERVPYVRPGVNAQAGVYPGETLGFYDFPGDTRLEENYTKSTDAGILINATQKVGDDLSFQFGYYGSKREREDRSASVSLRNIDEALSNPGSDAFFELQEAAPYLFDPTDPRFGNPDFTDPYGNFFGYNWGEKLSDQWRHQFRLEGAYSLPINQWWKNYFIFGITYNEIELTEGSRIFVTENPDYRPGQDLEERYDSAPNRVSPLNSSSPVSFDQGPGEFFAYRRSPPDATKFIEHGAYFIHQGTFWDNRVRTVSGFRYDKSFVKRPPERSNTTGEITEPKFKEGTPSVTNFTFGVSMQKDKTSPWALYFLTAGAIRPEFSRNDAAGNVIPPTQAISREAGLKFDFFDGKVSGTIAAYEVDREGVVRGSNEITVPEAGDPGYLGEDIHQRNALADDTSRGVDMQTIFTDLPFKNLQTVFNFSFNDYELTEISGPSYDGATSGTFSDKTIDFDKERRNNGTPPFTFKVWSKYEFKDGPLEGFDIGLGFRWVDEREAVDASAAGQNSDHPSFIELDPFTQLDMAVGYKNTFRDVRYNIRLNIFNLTGEDGFYGYAYRSPQGTTGRLTVSLNF